MPMAVLFPEGYTVEFNAGQYTEATANDFTELVLLGLAHPPDSVAFLETMIEQFENMFQAAQDSGLMAASAVTSCIYMLKIVGTGVLFIRRQLGQLWFTSPQRKLFMKNWLKFTTPVRLIQMIQKQRKLVHPEMRSYIWWFTCLVECFDGIDPQQLLEWKPLLRDFFNIHFPTLAQVYRDLNLISSSPVMPTRGLLSFGLRMDTFALAFKSESDSKISNVRDTLLRYGYLDCSKQRFTGQFARWHTIPVSMCFEDERYIDIVGESGYFSEWLYDYFRNFRLVVQLESGKLPVGPVGYFSQTLAVLLDTKKHESKPWFKDLQRIVRECPNWLLILMLNYSGEYCMKMSSIQVMPNEIGAWLFFHKYGANVDIVTLGAFLARAIYQKINKASCVGYARFLNEDFWKDIVRLPMHAAALFAGLMKFNQISGARMSLVQFKQGLKHWGIPNANRVGAVFASSVAANFSFFCAWCDSKIDKEDYVPCPNCKLTMYCSQTCCQDGSERHKKLCPIIRDIAHSNHGKQDSIEKFLNPKGTLAELARDITWFAQTAFTGLEGVTGFEADSYMEPEPCPQLNFPERCVPADPTGAKPSATVSKPDSQTKAKAADQSSKAAAKPDAQVKSTATTTAAKPVEQVKAAPSTSSSTDVAAASSTASNKNEETEETNTPGVFKCASCEKNEATLLCGRCFKVHYCNRDCQKAHWKIHKPTCTSS